MTVVVSDLVARVRAEGYAETRQAVAAVGAEAKATAEQLDQLSRKFAATQGGTSAGWREVLEKQGLSAAQVQQQLGAAAQQATRLASAAQQVAAPTQAAAKAATEVHEGFRLSESTAVRFGAGLVGIGLGISLAAGAARLLHGAIVDIVDGQLAWERSLVQVRGLYGAMAPQVVAFAQAQANMPGVIGTAQDFLQANLSARYLTTRYGVPAGTVGQLTSAAGRVAGTLGLDQRAAQELQGQFLQFAEGGGSGLRSIGIEGDPTFIARRLGYQSPAALAAFTPQQLREAQTLIATEGASRLSMEGAEGRPGLLAAHAQLQHEMNVAESNLRDALEHVGSSIEALPADPAARAAFLAGATGPRSATGGLQPDLSPFSPLGGPVPPSAQAEAARAALEKNTSALDAARKAYEDSAEGLKRFGILPGSATARLLSFTGSIEDPLSIAHADVAAQAMQLAADRARTANPPRAMSRAEMIALSQAQGYGEALRNLDAPTAQRAIAESNSNREEIERRASVAGPGLEGYRAAARQALVEADRRSAAAFAGRQAGAAGDWAGRARTEAESQLTALNLQSEERRLSVAQELASYRRETLNTEGQLAPLLLQQAELSDRMVVAGRDNLNTTRALITAQQAALPSQFGLANIDFGQRMLSARADASRAAFLRGGQTTEDIGDLRRQFYELDIQRAEQTPEALSRQHDVELVQQQQTQEGLARGLTLVDLEAERRKLEDQTIPLAEHLRITEAEEASIGRRLELRDLDDTKERTAAQFAITAADGLQLLVRSAADAAADYAAGLNLGATAAERTKAALQEGYTALNDSLLALSQVRSMVGPSVSEGLGRIGSWATPQATGSGGAVVVFQINGADRTAVRQQIVEHLDDFLSGAATSGPPAPAGVVGAGR